MITVNTNMASLIAQNSFNRASNSMNNALNRLSTGYRINSAKDDAAGSAIAAKLETKISSYAQATKNAEMGADYLQSADSTITTMQNMVQRMRDLTEQAANGTYGADERKAIQAEIDGLTQELYRIKNTTEFNGKKILGEEEQPTFPDYTAITTTMAEISSLSEASVDDVIAVSSVDDLLKLAELVKKGESTVGKTFALTNDIDMSSVKDFQGISAFSGTFNGNGFTIKNMSINKPDVSYVGFFARISNAEIKNLNFENANVVGMKSIGVFAGYSSSSVFSNCCVLNSFVESTFKTVGDNGQYMCQAGGFSGSISSSKFYNSSIKDSTIKAYDRLGGFSGEGKMFIDQCSIENVTFDVSDSINAQGFSPIGGLVYGGSEISNVAIIGGNQISNNNLSSFVFTRIYDPASIGATLTNCYTTINTGNGNVIDNKANNMETGCFYLEQNTVTNDSPTIKRSAEELKDINTYLAAGWDISNSKTADSIWYCDGTSTPVLRCNIDKIDKKMEDTSINLQVGIQADKNSTISVDTGFEMGKFKVTLDNDKAAQQSLAQIDALMDEITAKKTDIGASLNRLESVMAQQEAMRTSMTSSLSQIKDADIARESAIYVKNQILQQTTASLLATANQNPNIALNLL